MDLQASLTSSWFVRVLLILIRLSSIESSFAAFLTRQHMTKTSIPLSSSKNMDNDMVGENCWKHLKTQSVDMKSEKLRNHAEKCLEYCGNDLHLKSIVNNWIRLSDSNASAVQCLLKISELQGKVLKDTFWLTSNGDVLVYIGNSSNIIITWDILPWDQKTLEIMFQWIGPILLLVVISGNLLVLATMVCNMSRQDPRWIVRASLAISDFLRGSFVMTMAIRNATWLMTNIPRAPNVNYTQGMEFSEYLCRSLAIDTVYSSFCAVLFETTSVMSLQCLTFLAVERYLTCKYPQRTRQTPGTVKAVSIGMWSIGLGLPLVIIFTSEEKPGCGFFDPSTLLFILLPRAGFGHALHYLLIFYMAGLFVCTVLVLLMTMQIFIASSKEDLANIMKQSSPSLVEQQKTEDHAILMTMKMMLALHLLSVSPRFLLLIPGLRSEGRFLYFLFWWIFLLDSSWHWYVLNLRSRVFQDNLARLILRFSRLPRSFRATLESKLLPDACLTVELGHIWQMMESEISGRNQNHPTENLS
ncbi:uncharacterized protein LOC119580945 [Penaeus monodon]|uniref:uncharacterized protein LOC119580945 n=1 Tax=Penaeus monodon TaxID=6687 RepID=UPI0018A787E6|nr:uncharacterized protein LOC119580945 [Penaeus monodon]